MRLLSAWLTASCIAASCIAASCALTPCAVAATPDAAPDGFAPVRFLVGEWSGAANGQAGEGAVRRRYELVLGGRYIRETNVSTYPPQGANPNGEVHEHLSMLSYDKRRKLVVLRQFHAEGFVNQFTLAPGATAQRVVFDSESFENFSNEWRARETYEIAGPDEFTETFELAAPGQPFEVYSRTLLRRVITPSP